MLYFFIRFFKNRVWGNLAGKIGLFCAILALLGACTPCKKLKESEFLLVKNKVTADRKDVPTSDIGYVVRPRPNKRTFGIFLWKVGIYQSLQPDENQQDTNSVANTDTYCSHLKNILYNSFGKSEYLLDTVVVNKHIENFWNFRSWFQQNFGEPPVLLDTSLIDYSLQQITTSMLNRGWFNAKTEYTVQFKRKRASVHYSITAGIPFKIYRIDYQIDDEKIRNWVIADTARCLFKSGQQYDADKLDAERERIANYLLNRGYYGFSKNFIHYEADTNLNSYAVNIRMIISSPRYQIDDSTIVEGKHKCFKINTVTIYSDYSEWDNAQEKDLVNYTEIVKKTDTNHYRIFYYNAEQKYKPSALIYPVFFKQNDIYSRIRSQRTFDRFLTMKNFDYVKVLYSETAESMKNYRQDTGQLDCKIMLVNKKRQSMGFEILAKNIGGIFGLGGNITYLNRNLFKRAESLQATLKYTQEMQFDSTKANFDNFEAGGTIALEFPRFLFPIPPQNVPKNMYPKTLITLGINYLKQDYFARFLTNTSFTYEWSERKIAQQQRLTHSLSILDFSLVKMNLANGFMDTLRAKVPNVRTFQRMIERYKDVFLMGTTYQITLQKSTLYVFRANFRAYGNLLYGFMSAADKTTQKYKDTLGRYQIGGIPFGSGITADVDFVFNILQKRNDALVFHLSVGMGLPYGNSSALPFEYTYYLGGANSMRAWKARTLGPGSSIDSSGIDKGGDIKFEVNLEYRVPIYKRFHFGVFADAGNVWTMHSSLPNGNFAFNRFYKEIALCVGVGLRLDLSFFVIRLDYALKLHDPGKETANGWQQFNWKDYKTFRNDRGIVLGIGYPF
ncbi:MAG: BamA/TamA family outer membrane protein [Bacteroidales bacterium]|jgi:hypothetical protein|nr:BamA/TamA family outer membrane protein [Bacteroidales bacterium]